MRVIRFSKKSKPTSSIDPSIEYRVVFESLFLGTFLLVAIVTILLFASYFLLHNTYVIGRILVCGVATLYLVIVSVLWNRRYTSLASKGLILFYFGIAGLILYVWGISTIFGILLLAISIILAGILLGARYTLYLGAMAIILIFFIQWAHPPSIPITLRPSNYGDATAYSALLAILALISWLFGKQTERLFAKNRLAEQALIKEKESLEVRVAERTEQLQKAQMKELQQLYQFAEMGQLSAALLHDLANHLSVLTFDIADLKRQQHTEAIKRAEESVSFLENAVRQVRSQLQGKSEHQRFDAVRCVKESVALIARKAHESHVVVSFQSSLKSVFVKGDPLRLGHIITILVRNGIEAYKADNQDGQTVTITMEATQNKVIIRIRDQGVGLSPTQRKHLFTPVKSTKKEGLGIGLFIATKIIETHFKGTLSLNPTTDYTEFTLEIPKSS